MPHILSMLLLAVGLALAGCEDREPGSLENVEQNPQEYHNTATDPQGPREISPPNEAPVE